MSKTNRIKIALIGAGSVEFASGTIADILLSETLNEFELELSLMDIAPERLGQAESYACQAAQLLNRRPKIYTTTQLQDAIDGATFVVTAIEVNRYYYWSQDFHIPKKYGFAQIYGENGGPGGMFHALRNMGPMLEIAGAMEKLCPDAWLINYSNPEAKLVQAVSMLTNTRAVGLCHGVFMGRRDLSRILEIPEQELETSACGLNHFAWFQSIKHKKTGEDLYPLLREKEKQAHWLASWDELALNRLLFRTFGLWPYPGTNHTGEYIRWSQELIASSHMQFFYDPVGGNLAETTEVPTFVYNLESKPTEIPLFGSENITQLYPDFEQKHPSSDKEITPSGEEGILIMEAVAGGVTHKMSTVNISNRGSIPDLPDDLVVEVPATVNKTGIHPQKMSPLPTGITAMLQVQGNINKLLIEAYVEKSRKKLLQALLIDPTVSTYANAVALINEMYALQKDILPPMHW